MAIPVSTIAFAVVVRSEALSPKASSEPRTLYTTRYIGSPLGVAI